MLGTSRRLVLELVESVGYVAGIDMSRVRAL
jgi:hypothetical protein